MDKRGSIVEAAIVLPILILTVVSMILLLLFFHAVVQDRTDLQEEVRAQADKRQVVFTICRAEKITSSRMQGITAVLMRHREKSFCYALDPALAVRLGEAVRYGQEAE